MAFRLRRALGFQPPLAPELGYGKAVHHILRRIADHVKLYQRAPTPNDINQLFDEEFYLPAASRAGYAQMRASAERIVNRYLDDWVDDLHRTWAVERPFELHLRRAIISGRADVIIDESEGEFKLAIVDYKTAADKHDSHAFQLQVYTDAGRREGLTVDAAYVHDLKAAERHPVSVSEADVASAEALVNLLVDELRARQFPARPGPICDRCDVSGLCRYRLA
jgi:DNA helicase-2/ATP-dependent DNA helicase PcrA